MSVEIKTMGDGQLSDSANTTLYTAPAATQGILKEISLVNTHTSAVTCNMYRKKSGGSSRRIIPKDLSLGAGESWHEIRAVTLEAADIIEGDASVASKVDYCLSGVENS